MGIAEIKQLPLHEKLQILEALWEDLAQNLNESDIPKEHKKLLDTRRDEVKNGKATLLDWDQVKGQLGRA